MGIWFRRLLVIPLGMVFMLLLTLTLVLLQIEDTLLNPDHLIEEAREAGVYEFVMVDLLASLVDEAREIDTVTISDELDENPLTLFNLSTEEITVSANRAISREWLEGVFEESIVQFSMYMSGEKEDLLVTPNARIQGERAIREVRRLLDQADAYDILYARIVDPRVEALIEGIDFPQGFEPPPERVIAGLRQVVPPDWVQRQFEIALTDLTPYLLGERDEFRIVVPMGDLSEIALWEFKKLLRDIDTYEWLAKDVVSASVQEALELGAGRAFRVDDDRLIEAVERVVTSEWLQTQVEKMIDDSGPFITGTGESFNIHVPLSDRAELALGEVLLILEEEEEMDLPYRLFVEPRLLETVGDSLHLQFGVSVTGEEVVSALHENAPSYWFKQHANRLLLDASPYLMGEADYFESRIALTANKSTAHRAVTDLVRERTSALIHSLPQCTSPEEAEEALLTRGSDELPSCIESDITANQMLIQMGLNSYEIVTRVVMSRLPDNAVFDERQLRRYLSQAGFKGTLDLHVISYFTRDTSETVPDLVLDGTFEPSELGKTGMLAPDDRANQNLVALDQTRDLLRNGWTYSDANLLRDLEERGTDSVRRLDEVREIMAEGWSFTEADLHQLLRREGGGLSELGGNTDPVKRLDDIRAFLSEDWTYTQEDFREYLAQNLPSGGLSTFDAVRSILKLMRFSALVVWIPLALLLLSIGYLGGRVWSTRISWAMVILLISSGLVYLAFNSDYGNFAKSGPLYESVGISDFSQFRENLIDMDGGPSDFTNSYRMAADKLIDMSEPTIDQMAEGIAAYSRNLVLFAVVGLVVSILLPAIAATTASILRNRGTGLLKKWGTGRSGTSSPRQ